MYLQERIQLETARLYKLAGINPLAGINITFLFLLLYHFEIPLLLSFVCACMDVIT